MASLGQVFDASTVEPNIPFEVLSPGKYLAQIVASEMRATKDGAGQYLNLELDILDGQYSGRKLFDRLDLDRYASDLPYDGQPEDTDEVEECDRHFGLKR